MLPDGSGEHEAREVLNNLGLIGAIQADINQLPDAISCFIYILN